jgi:hypothetical protein
MKAVQAINAAASIINDVRAGMGDNPDQFELSKAQIILKEGLESAEKAKAVLQKLVESFPEMDTDAPINGSDAVDVLCSLWDEIKEATL